jgi:hypothetical protein
LHLAAERDGTLGVRQDSDTGLKLTFPVVVSSASKHSSSSLGAHWPDVRRSYDAVEEQTNRSTTEYEGKQVGQATKPTLHEHDVVLAVVVMRIVQHGLERNVAQLLVVALRNRKHNDALSSQAGAAHSRGKRH